MVRSIITHFIVCPQITLETTIGNSNVDLWKFVHPTDSVMEWLRNIVANRLASTAKEWAEIFKKFNSGTWVLTWNMLFWRRILFFTFYSFREIPVKRFWFSPVYMSIQQNYTIVSLWTTKYLRKHICKLSINANNVLWTNRKIKQVVYFWITWCLWGQLGLQSQQDVYCAILNQSRAYSK